MNSSRLNRRDEVPPGGFRYLVEETRTWIIGPNYSEWVKNIKKHYVGNGMEPPLDLEEKIEDALCKILPAGSCNQDPPIEGIHLTMSGVIAGTKTLLGYFAQGRKKVSQEEADRRADICSRCVYNQKPDGCHSCAWIELYGVISGIIGAGETKYNHYLEGCALCSCSLKAKVWLELDLLQANTSKDINNKLPEWCWLKKPIDSGEITP